LFEDLGFVLYCENIWFKYIEENSVKIPNFILTRLVNPKENKFLVRNLLNNNDELVTDNFKELKNFLKKSKREQIIDNLLNL
jgi:hypothetical protein